MNKICTSIEQSKKLMELGINVNTADMRYGYIAPYEFSDRIFDGGYDEVPYLKDFLRKNPNFSENEYDGELPAWSLSALLEIIRNHDRHELYLYEGGYYFECGEFMTESYFNPIDAAFEMVCWLLENKMI